MREPNALEPDIRAHLEAENTWTEQALAPIAALREELAAELKARIKEDDFSVPTPDGDWAYYHRFVEGGQHPLLCRRPTKDADAAREQVLLDCDAEAKGEILFGRRRRAFARSPDVCYCHRQQRVRVLQDRYP